MKNLQKKFEKYCEKESKKDQTRNKKKIQDISDKYGKNFCEFVMTDFLSQYP